MNRLYLFRGNELAFKRRNREFEPSQVKIEIGLREKKRTEKTSPVRVLKPLSFQKTSCLNLRFLEYFERPSLSLFLKEKYRTPTFTALRSKLGASKLKKPPDLWTIFPLKTTPAETLGRRGERNTPLL
ncbi:hypothetical protein, partial [Leptospira santarosai]|uniref:hypothetical protein n=1 Tax=Leptospira santarosai TaxID=28183 RepID=UPI001C4B478E